VIHAVDDGRWENCPALQGRRAEQGAGPRWLAPRDGPRLLVAGNSPEVPKENRSRDRGADIGRPLGRGISFAECDGDGDYGDAPGGPILKKSICRPHGEKDCCPKSWVHPERAQTGQSRPAPGPMRLRSRRALRPATGLPFGAKKFTPRGKMQTMWGPWRDILGGRLADGVLWRGLSAEIGDRTDGARKMRLSPGDAIDRVDHDEPDRGRRGQGRSWSTMVSIPREVDSGRSKEGPARGGPRAFHPIARETFVKFRASRGPRAEGRKTDEAVFGEKVVGAGLFSHRRRRE